MSAERDIYENLNNPLDCVEQVLTDHNWVFDRMTRDELMVQVKGRSCFYRLFFIWQEDMNALQFCCQYDFTIDAARHSGLERTLCTINEDLWMGHFDLPESTGVPSFRHTSLLRSVNQDQASDLIEDMVDIALVQCERFYPAFNLLARTEGSNDRMLALALMEPEGES